MRHLLGFSQIIWQLEQQQPKQQQQQFIGTQRTKLDSFNELKDWVATLSVSLQNTDKYFTQSFDVSPLIECEEQIK